METEAGVSAASPCESPGLEVPCLLKPNHFPCSLFASA